MQCIHIVIGFVTVMAEKYCITFMLTFSDFFIVSVVKVVKTFVCEGCFFLVVCLSRVWFLLYLTFRFILISIYSVPLLFHLVVCRYFIGLAQYYVHRDRMQTKYKQISNQFVRNITITTIHIFCCFRGIDINRSFSI